MAKKRIERVKEQLGNRYMFDKWFALLLTGEASYRELVPYMAAMKQDNCFFQRVARAVSDSNGNGYTLLSDSFQTLEDPLEDKYSDIEAGRDTRQSIIEEMLQGINGWLAKDLQDRLKDFMTNPEEKDPEAKDFKPIRPPLKGYHQITMNDVLEILKGQRWVWQDWFPRGQLSVLAGEPAIGKTSVLATLADIYFNGGPWPDGSLHEPHVREKPIVWIDTEHGQGIVADRIEKWKLNQNNFVWPSLSDERFPTIRLDEDRWLNALEKCIVDNDSDWVMVDTLRNSFRGDENSSEVQEYLASVARLAQRQDVNILFSTHLRKGLTRFSEEPENAELLQLIRGSSAISAQCRTAAVLWRPDRRTPHLRRLELVKSNYGQTPPPIGVEITDTQLIFTREYPMVPVQPTAKNRARAWILENLGPGEEIAVKEIRQMIEEDEDAPSWASFKRAKAELTKDGLVQGGKGEASWSRPEEVVET